MIHIRLRLPLQVLNCKYYLIRDSLLFNKNLKLHIINPSFFRPSNFTEELNTDIAGHAEEPYFKFFMLLFPIGIFFYILFYINLPFIEESTDFRIIQKIQPFIYWTTYWLTDCVIHALLCGLFICTVWLFDKPSVLQGYSSPIFLTVKVVGSIYL